MTPGSEAFSWGLRVCVWLLPAGRRRGGPCNGPFTPQERTKPSANSEVGGGELGKRAGREECPLPAEMVWEGWGQPHPSALAGLSSRGPCFGGWTEKHLEGWEAVGHFAAQGGDQTLSSTQSLRLLSAWSPFLRPQFPQMSSSSVCGLGCSFWLARLFRLS